MNKSSCTFCWWFPPLLVYFGRCPYWHKWTAPSTVSANAGYCQLFVCHIEPSWIRFAGQEYCSWLLVGYCSPTLPVIASNYHFSHWRLYSIIMFVDDDFDLLLCGILTIMLVLQLMRFTNIIISCYRFCESHGHHVLELSWPATTISH